MLSASEDSIIQVNASQLLIRRMKEADVNQIMEIESVSFGRHHWSADSFLNEMNNQMARYFSLIDTEANKLIGYCGVWQVIDEGHITTVAIRPEYRGNALGELMLLQMIDLAYSLSIRWLTLEVRVSNYNAQNLYYKYGFESQGLRPKYYQDNKEDAMIMTTPDMMTENYRTLYNSKKDLHKNRLGGFPEGFGTK